LHGFAAPAADFGIIDPVGIDLAVLEALFDVVPDVVFFAKDRDGRYTSVNETLVARCGRRHKRELLGKTPLDLFPRPLAEAYAAQDRQVVASGAPVLDRLELHLFPSRSPGWCLTRKLPLRDAGRVTGLIGISRDLGRPDRTGPIYPRLRRAVEHLRDHVAEPVRIDALAGLAGMSVSQLERQFRRVFQLTPRSFLRQLRLDRAARLLERGGNIAAIAQSCGYADHSAFTRQFRSVVGVTPRDYQRLAAHV
jgi:AraC-like DNA-binding protein